MNKPVQDLTVKRESLIKPKQELFISSGNERFRKLNRNHRGSLVNRIQDMEDRISGTKDMIEGIDTSVKENVKSEKILTQHFQEI